jgi:hypothetical protein
MPKHTHKRKLPTRRAELWAAGIMDLHAESGGLMRLHIMPPQDALPLLASALMGDAEARRLVQALADALRQIQTAPCRLQGGAVICVAFADRSAPGCGLAFALCGHCTRDAAAVPEKALAALKTLWPDGRLVEVTHPNGGTA